MATHAHASTPPAPPLSCKDAGQPATPTTPPPTRCQWKPKRHRFQRLASCRAHAPSARSMPRCYQPGTDNQGAFKGSADTPAPAFRALSPRSGPGTDQRSASGSHSCRFSRSAAIAALYHQQTKNLLSVPDTCTADSTQRLELSTPHRTHAASRASDQRHRAADDPSGRASTERHERRFSVKISPVTPTPHIMRTRKTAGQVPFAAFSSTTTHST